MGRGVSSGGGQSSLGYLFGGDVPSVPKPVPNNVEAPPCNPPPAPAATKASVVVPPPAEGTKQIPAGIQGSQKNNNYQRADGQNTGNFLTLNNLSDRPSTKVHAAPGGGSSLGYLFGDGGN
ncbi:Protein SPIRAL1-like 1 [Orobanche gracilis]